MPPRTKHIRIAILDLYAGQLNEGMRCLRELIKEYGRSHKLKITCKEYEVRCNMELPDMSYDIYISSGGPGSPLESRGSDWEKAYFKWLKSVEKWNKNPGLFKSKHVLFICHSFELVCRHYKIATVCKRKSMAFGIFPVHLLREGKDEFIFEGLSDPFYAVDSRSYQIVKPNNSIIEKMGSAILAIEKERPHVPLERAIMAIRFNDCMVGTQFHPEADVNGTRKLLNDKKDAIVESHGEEKWNSMIEQLDDPGKIKATHSHIIANFLTSALHSHD